MGSYQETKLAYVNDEIALHAKVRFRLDGEIIDTTVGRIIFNSVLPDGFEFQNRMIGKKQIVEIRSQTVYNIWESARIGAEVIEGICNESSTENQ